MSHCQTQTRASCPYVHKSQPCIIPKSIAGFIGHVTIKNTREQSPLMAYQIRDCRALERDEVTRILLQAS